MFKSKPNKTNQVSDTNSQITEIVTPDLSTKNFEDDQITKILLPTSEELKRKTGVDGNELSDKIVAQDKSYDLNKTINKLEINSYIKLLEGYDNILPRLQSYFTKRLLAGLISRRVISNPNDASATVRPLKDQAAAEAMTTLLDKMRAVILIDDRINKKFFSLNEYYAYLMSRTEDMDKLLISPTNKALSQEMNSIKQDCKGILKQLQKENIAKEVVQPINDALLRLLNSYDNLAADISVWNIDRYQAANTVIWTYWRKKRGEDAANAIISQMSIDNNEALFEVQLIKAGIEYIKKLAVIGDNTKESIEVQQELFKILNRLNYSQRRADIKLGDLLMSSAATKKGVFGCKIGDSEPLQALAARAEGLLKAAETNFLKNDIEK